MEILDLKCKECGSNDLRVHIKSRIVYCYACDVQYTISIMFPETNFGFLLNEMEATQTFNPADIKENRTVKILSDMRDYLASINENTRKLIEMHKDDSGNKKPF